MNKLFAKIMLAIIVVMMLLTLLPVASVSAQTNDSGTDVTENGGGGLPADAVAKVGDTYYSDLEEAINASSQEYPAIMLKDVTESGKGYYVKKDGAVLNTNGYTLSLTYTGNNTIVCKHNYSFTINGSGDKENPDLIVGQIWGNPGQSELDKNKGIYLNDVYLKTSINDHDSLLFSAGHLVLKDCKINSTNKNAIFLNANPGNECLVEFNGHNIVIGNVVIGNGASEIRNGKLDVIDGSIKKTITIPNDLIGGRGDELSTVRLPEGWEWVDSTEVLSSSEYVRDQEVYAKYKIPNDGYDYSGNGDLIDGGKYVKCELRIRLVKSNKWDVEPNIDDWTYGETAKDPVGKSLFGDVEFTYKLENDDIYTTDKPSKPGNYLMRAYVEQNAWHHEYTGLEKIVCFTIHKAIPTYTIPTDLNGVEGESLASVELPSGFSWKDSKQLITKSGVYQAVYTPKDTECYATVDVEINVKMLAKPVIKGDDVTLELGVEFDPLDYVIANDEADGDLTNDIEIISNNVDTSKPGVYEITYKVTNSLGVSNIKTIKVEVLGEGVETPESSVKPESAIKPQVEVPNYDDGGPFTTDKCGSVYDRWGNLIWKAPSCKAPVDGNYNIVNTSDK